jgi:hypothetical protein
MPPDGRHFPLSRSPFECILRSGQRQSAGRFSASSFLC